MINNNKHQVGLNSQKAREASILIASIPLLILVALDYYINVKISGMIDNKLICGIINVVLGICIFIVVELFMGFMYVKVFKGKELEKFDFMLSLEKGELIPVYFKAYSKDEYHNTEYMDEVLRDEGYKYYLQLFDDNNMYIVVQDEKEEEVYREAIEDFEGFKNIFYVSLNQAI